MSLATLLAVAALALQPTAPGGPAPGYRLLLVYHGIDADTDRAVAPLLAAFAEEYGPQGLAVAAPAEFRSGWSGLAARPPVLPPAGPAALSVRAADGAVRLTQPPDAVDLYAVYRLCESELRGRGRVGYAEHVRLLLETHLVGETVLLGGGSAAPGTLTALLSERGVACLFLPPGCSPCLLGKHAAGVAAAIAAVPRRPVVAYEPVVAAALRREGWRGSLHLLPLDGAARILQLRQSGVYAPLLVGLGPDGALTVAPLPPAAEERR